MKNMYLPAPIWAGTHGLPWSHANNVGSIHPPKRIYTPPTRGNTPHNRRVKGCFQICISGEPYTETLISRLLLLFCSSQWLCECGTRSNIPCWTIGNDSAGGHLPKSSLEQKRICGMIISHNQEEFRRRPRVGCGVRYSVRSC